MPRADTALREQEPRSGSREGRPTQFKPVLGWAAVGGLLRAFELSVRP